MMQNQNNSMKWLVIASMNGQRCVYCGKLMNEFKTGTCWFTTCGLVQFGHPELEMVVQLLPEYMLAVLNAFGKLVQDGKKLKSGEVVRFEGVEELFHLKEFEVDGKKVLRVIVSDPKGRYPEDEGCEYPFSMQLKTLDELVVRKECTCTAIRE